MEKIEGLEARLERKIEMKTPGRVALVFGLVQEENYPECRRHENTIISLK